MESLWGHVPVYLGMPGPDLAWETGPVRRPEPARPAGATERPAPAEHHAH